MKGIILAGGNGTRLHPITRAITKQLLPIYDKPMIYYPLSVLMMSGIKDIMIISDPYHLPKFEELLGDGKSLGIRISYKAQSAPEGIAQAFILAEDFIGKESVCLILGDNIFYGEEFTELVRESKDIKEGAIIFGYYVKDPERYGVVEFDNNLNAISIEEKPNKPKSNFAVPGLYFYDNNIVKIAKSLKKSPRGEYEITDVHKAYLLAKKLKVKILGRGIAWLDTGTHDSFLEASNFIQTIEKRQGLKIGCPEEIALRMGFIDKAKFNKLVDEMPDNNYKEYLKFILKEYGKVVSAFY